MKAVHLNLGHTHFTIDVPDSADVLSMGFCSPLKNPKQSITSALAHPASGPSLKAIVQKKLEKSPQSEAVIVLSDNTRPVPYRDEDGSLVPILDTLLDAGLSSSRIRLLVATGTHRLMTEEELENLIDPKVFSLGVDILQHDSRDPG